MATLLDFDFQGASGSSLDRLSHTVLYAGRVYYLEATWKRGTAGTFQTVLTCAGATLFSGFSLSDTSTLTDAAGNLRTMLGWSPEVDCYFESYECATGFWKIVFPTAGSYSVVLSGLGTIPAEVDAETTETYVTVRRLASPSGSPGLVGCEVSYSGTYPSGGLTLTSGMCGVAYLQNLSIEDTSLYQFAYSPTTKRLTVYLRAGGEASGTINFTAQGMLIALAL